MDVHKCYLVVTFLLSLQCTDAGGSCQENVYLEVGKQGVVSCHFVDFDVIGWIHGSGDVTGTSPFIHKEGSKIYGRGYESGDYDLHPNGSLIINEVKLTNKFNYTVLLVPLLTGANEYFEVPVNVYGGSCQENIYLEVGKQGVVSCHFENFDIIGWINGTGDVTDTSPFIYMEGSQIYGQGYDSGDYGMHPNGSLIINEVKLENEFNYTVLFVFHPAGANKYFEVPVKVYVPVDPGFPVVNGQTNQVIVQGNTRGFINCSLTGIRPKVALEWVASPNEISLDSEHRVTDNSDGTYNTYLTSSYKVINSPTWRVSLICSVAGQMADLFPSVTTVYLLLERRFPAVNGLANQQHVVLDVNREGELTCSMDKVSQDVSLELVNIIPDSSDEMLLNSKNNITANGDDTVNITLTSRFRVLSDSTEHFTLKCRVSGQAADKYPEATTVELLVTENLRCLSPITDRIDTHRSGFYDIITSCRYIVDEPSIDTMVRCFLSGTDRNNQPVNSTVKAKVMWQDQDWEGRTGWPQTVNTVILMILLIEMNLILVICLKHKDYVRKFYRNRANPRQQTDLEEAVAADHQSIKKMQPLKNRADSGMSSCLRSSIASGHHRELEGRNVQDIENVC